MSFEDQIHPAPKRSTGDRYSDVELRNVVVSKPPSTLRQGREGTMAEEQLRSAACNQDEDMKPQLALFSPLTRLYTIAHLVLFSILGTLARLGLEAITSYPSAPVTSAVVWPNLGGSFMLGFLNGDRRIFREEWGTFSSSKDWSFHPTALKSNDGDRIQRAFRKHDEIKRTIPLFVGLATGFCGSFTSFSSFVRDAFLALGNTLPSPGQTAPSIPSRNGGYSFESFLAIVIIHVTVSLSAYKGGGHLASALDSVMPRVPFRSMRMILDPVVVIVGFGSWIGAVFLTIFPPHQCWRQSVTFALVFAPVGCLVRFYATKSLNGRIPSFPLGTFAVNMFGSVILGMCFDLQRSATGARDVLSCQVLQGVMDGFCGCATTVSTWVAELNALERQQSYIYGVASIVVAVSFLTVVMGSLQWSRGYQEPVCL